MPLKRKIEFGRRFSPSFWDESKNGDFIKQLKAMIRKEICNDLSSFLVDNKDQFFLIRYSEELGRITITVYPVTEDRGDSSD